MTDLPIERIEALALEHGDILIVTLPNSATFESVEQARRILADKLPDQETLVITAGTTIDAYRPVNR